MIDADSDSSASIAIALEAQGYHVLTSTNIAGGIQLVQTRRPHALVVHLDMSDADGCGMREFARAHLRMKDMPVALLLVAKPCDPGALAAQLRSLWNQRGGDCGNDGL